MGMTLAMALVGRPIHETVDVLDEILEDLSAATRHADARAGWPAESALALAEIVKGLVGPRLRRNRLPLTTALTGVEALAQTADVRAGVAVPPDVRECVVCMSAPRAVRFGCGHSICCGECADALVARGDVCPGCRCPLRIVMRGEHLATEQTFVAPGDAPMPQV